MHVRPPAAPVNASFGGVDGREARQARRLAADACALLQTEGAAAMAPLEAALEALGGLGAAGIDGLCSVLRQLLAPSAGGSACHGAALAERLVSRYQRAAIEALAQAGAEAPGALAGAYAASGGEEIGDALCEAAGRTGSTHPALKALMRQHLACNAFVAGLSLAEHGDASALPLLYRRLEAELRAAGGGHGAQGAKGERAALHVEGLAEAIVALGGELSAATAAAVSHIKRSSQPTHGGWPLAAFTPHLELPTR